MIEYKLHITKKTLFLAIRSCAVAFLCVIALIFFARAITQATDDTVHSRNEFVMLTKKYGIADQLSRDNDTLAETIVKLENAIPTMDDVIRVEEYLTMVSAKTMNDTTLLFGSGLQTTVGSALGELPLTITLTGTRKSLDDFLRAIETGPYIIPVKSVSLGLTSSGSAETAASETLVAQISASVFLKTQ